MRAAIYCRLSKEDEDKQLESESIQNQRALLTEYAAGRGWEVCGVYCDEDYSGVDRARPEFLRLLSDAEAGEFDLVLCKTQSRFTRDMELVEKYIHGLFPLWGVRFVAVVDNIDTDVKGNKKARQISGLINEWYLEDLSENVRAVFDYKRRAGQYIGSFPLYGYRKVSGDKNRLEPDPEAAGVVRRIFGLYLSGCGKQRIAARLNREGVPNPTRYKQGLGWNYRNGGERGGEGLWSRTTVGRILREPMYTGDLVQGRRRKVSYKSKACRSLPPSEWVVSPHAHEAIIDRETFEAVQRLLDGRTRSGGTGQVHPLSGRVRCLDCGSAMVKVSTTYKGERRSYLRCKNYASGGACGSHSVRLDALEALVAARLWGHLAEDYGEVSAAVEDRSAEARDRALDREIGALEGELERRERALRCLYLDRAAGTIGPEQFTALSRTFLEEGERSRRRLEELRAERGEGTGEREDWEEPLLRGILTREAVAEFVELVEVGQRDPDTGEQSVRIRWSF